ITGCSEGGTISFVVPPTQTRQICGWPAGFGFEGDECFNAPIAGGTGGRTVTVAYNCSGGGWRGSGGSCKSRPGTGRGSSAAGGGGSGSACNCVPGADGGLRIKSCNANNSLNCSSTKSLTLKACGGVPPYSWSKTGSVTLSATTGTTITVRPPTNTG